MTELSDQQKLVKAELESGHCQQTSAILESLPSFEERVHFLKAIDAKNKEETKADENLPMISLQAKANDYGATIGIFRKAHEKDWTGGLMYNQTTNIDTLKTRTACVDFLEIKEK